MNDQRLNKDVKGKITEIIGNYIICLKEKERYSQLEKYTVDEIYDMIKNMKEVKKWNFAQIAETLGIHIYDVTMW